MEAIKLQKEPVRFKYKDYAEWETDERYELIDGIPFMMAAPGGRHQDALAELIIQFKSFLRGKSCRARIAPFDVRLNAKKRDDTVVQPDLLVVCDPKKIQDDKYCIGAPDMVIEILSPSTRRHDMILKREKYREAGVLEYWLIDLDDNAVHVHTLKDGQYFVTGYLNPEKLPVGVLKGLDVSFEYIFENTENKREEGSQE